MIQHCTWQSSRAKSTARAGSAPPAAAARYARASECEARSWLRMEAWPFCTLKLQLQLGWGWVGGFVHACAFVRAWAGEQVSGTGDGHSPLSDTVT